MYSSASVIPVTLGNFSGQLSWRTLADECFSYSYQNMLKAWKLDIYLEVKSPNDITLDSKVRFRRQFPADY